MIRLSFQTQRAIIELFKKYFPGAKLYLFGSRANPNARGGDIDLLCESDDDLRTLSKNQTLFLNELYKEIGEQRIDFVLFRPSDTPDLPIAKIAKETGVRLDMNIELEIEFYFATAERHYKRLNWAMNKMPKLIPLTSESIENLSDENFAVLEVFVGRFSKLQDIVGKKILPSILELTEEPDEYPTFIDKLNRLEKIRAIESADDWKMLREIRNKFTHDYSDNPKINAQNINDAYHAAQILLSMYAKIKTFIAEQIKKNNQKK